MILQSLRDAILEVDGVKSAIVNETDSFEIHCIVDGGDKVDIARAIFENLPLGVRTIGNTSHNLKSSISEAIYPINFSRPNVTPVQDVSSEYNCKCDLCGEDAYKGFHNVECSNMTCEWYKG